MRLHLTVPRTTPDLDGLACAITYAELLLAQSIPARPWIAGSPDPEARFVADHLGVRLDPTPPPDDCAFILVDASDLRGMPEALDALRVVEVIDHRLHHHAAELFPNAALCIEPVGAAATLIAERHHALGIPPSPLAAKLLQAAIMSNTQALRGTITTERDHAAYRTLAALFPLDDAFIAAQFDARRRAILLDLRAAIVLERKDFDHADGAYILSQLEFPGARHHVDDCLPHVEQLGSRAMLNLVDVEDAVSLLLVPDPTCRAWVSRRAGLHFDGPVATSPGILLRKQIVARLEGRS
ncbi:DHH family phosphoesterase [Polyangium jinanense]|uniref:hypothetical protein n=1 Tax=Polyangium jinanense TaxID=2829994 RepID=UPI002340A4BC|nr:hypothetical protein [Polyangium jinanense]MDC3956913.1 DHH family phosphoesterase [Polyangium jinanense]